MISFGTAVRLIVGWFSVVIGILNLLAEADRRTGEADLPYLIFHCVLIAGGIMLLALNSLAADPGLVGYAAGGAVAAVGLVVGSVLGFPFGLRADSGGDGPHLIADLLFWGYAGLFVLVVSALTRRVTFRPGDPPARHQHAEPTAHADRRLPADGSVGGLP